MGAESSQRSNDAVNEVAQPAVSSRPTVDLADRDTVRSVFGSQSSSEIDPKHNFPQLAFENGISGNGLTQPSGQPLDQMISRIGSNGTILPPIQLMDGNRDVTNGAAPEAVTTGEILQAVANGDSSKQALLPQSRLEDAKIRSREGYHQVSSRLLGNGFSSAERNEFTNALKENWNSDPAHAQKGYLSRNDRLLTQENMNSVLGSIKDEGLRSRIRDRLLSQSDAPAQNGQRKNNGQPSTTDRPPEGETLPNSTDRTTPQGEFKSPYLRRYNEGDRFQGKTSVYWEDTSTASGIPFNKNQMTAASREFPFGTILSVEDPKTGRSVQVVVTDNGPFAEKKVSRPDGSKTWDRVLDISSGAARALGINPDNVYNLNVTVDKLPQNGAWGGQRRNIHGAERRAVEEDIRRLSRRGRNA